MKFLFYASAALASLGSFAFAKTHLVTVGANGQLAYDPPFIHAHKGDWVKFLFEPKNHTVTQSSFEQPCTKLTDHWGRSIGFDSGFHPVNPYNPRPTVVKVEVLSTKPLWFYCRQTGHCSKGMVFAINPPKEGNTFDAFRMKALATAVNTTTPVNGTATVIDVTVGINGTLTYTPPYVDAKPGDEVRFKFVAKNHTLTQSSFNSPCSPLTNGFDTGFEFVGTSNNTITKSFIVPNTSNPLWFYCRQKVPSSHCAQGMVFAINAPKTGNTFEEFKKKALATGNSTTPTNSTRH